MSFGIRKHQTGFTLVELMISLALGLIISAAAIMLFLTGQKSYSLQQGVADLQDNANFGLGYITKDIRQTNLNSNSAEINDRTAIGGVVLTSSVNADKDTDGTTPLSNLAKSITGDTAKITLVSSSEIGASNANFGSSDLKSDQLVIQYKPQYVRVDNNTPPTPTNLDDDVWFGGFDCEGNKVEFPVKTGSANTPLRIIVQRYFLREDNNKASSEPNTALALACDAGWYNESGNPAQVEDYSDNGEIIMKRVDYFHVLLGVQNGDKHRYISIKDYMTPTATKPRPRILSVQLGALVRSTQSVGGDNLIKNDQKFQVLDNEVTVKVPTSSSVKYVRQVVSQTVALRNTFGERGK